MDYLQSEASWEYVKKLLEYEIMFYCYLSY